MSGYSVLAWILVAVAIAYAANHPAKVKDAISQSAGFLVTVVFFLLLAVMLAPWLKGLTENGLRNNYGAELDSISISNPFASLGGGQRYDTSSAEFFLDETSPETDPIQPPDPTSAARQYVVVAGDTLQAIADRNGIPLNALMQLNGIVDPNRIVVGQVILLADAVDADEAGGGVGVEGVPVYTPHPETTPAPQTAPRPTPTLTPTAVSFELEYNMLAALRLLGGTACPTEIERHIFESATTVRMTARMCATQLVQDILETRPGDSYASQMAQEIGNAELTLTAMNRLGERTPANLLGLRAFTYSSGAENEVDRLLRGFSYEIVSVDTEFTGGSWVEEATVEVISEGWLLGERFTLARGHTTRHGGKNPGDEFRVD